MTDPVCPPLGTGSVDFNALHDAATNGENLVEAIAQATTKEEPLTEAEFSKLPSLSGKTRAQLEHIAAEEEVELTEEMDTNPKIAAAIQAKRDGLLVVDSAGTVLNPPQDEPNESDADDGDGAD